jgi:hypothetical protein
MLQPHLFVEALVASWRAAPAVRRRLLNNADSVHDGGCLVFRVPPPDWREERYPARVPRWHLHASNAEPVLRISNPVGPGIRLSIEKMFRKSSRRPGAPGATVMAA